MTLGFLLFMVGASAMDSDIRIVPVLMIVTGLALVVRGYRKCLN